jgi:hypothetical protein
MFVAGALTFQEFMMHESLPLATIQQAVLEFLQGRDDAVVFGAQAVNAYVNEPRMTQDIDLLSSRAEQFAQELRDHLGERFHIAVRVRQVGQDKGYRLFQVQKPHNRHLVDVRSVETLPSAQRMADVLVMAPAELIASKVMAYYRRRGQPKSGTDWRDLAMLLLAFPEFKRDQSLVADCLRTAGAEPAVLTLWKELVAQEIHSEDEDGEF